MAEEQHVEIVTFSLPEAVRLPSPPPSAKVDSHQEPLLTKTRAARSYNVRSWHPSPLRRRSLGVEGFVVRGMELGVKIRGRG
jgi:hypothetical protein